MSAREDAMRHAVQQELLRRELISTFTKALGGGLFLGGTAGLLSTLTGSKEKKRRESLLTSRSVPIPIDRDPVPVKTAGFMEDAKNKVVDFFSGETAPAYKEMPLRLPALGTAFFLGGLGGWKLTDSLMVAARKRQVAKEIADAQKKYEKALLRAGDKQASALGQALDGLFDTCQSLEQKMAQTKSATHQKSSGLGNLSGATLTLLLPFLFAGGYAGYKYGKKRLRSNVLLEAAEARMREQAKSLPIYAYGTTRSADLDAPYEDQNASKHI